MTGSGLLTHSAAEIVRQYLVDQGIVSNPDIATGTSEDWPMYLDHFPEGDQALAISDTIGRQGGRALGETCEQPGIQISGRALRRRPLRNKITEIAKAFEALFHADVTVAAYEDLAAANYDLWAVHISSSPESTGRESPDTHRRLFSLNGIVVVTQL